MRNRLILARPQSLAVRGRALTLDGSSRPRLSVPTEVGLLPMCEVQRGKRERKDAGSSHPGELPPEVLTEPYVKLSPHTALVIQP